MEKNEMGRRREGEVGKDLEPNMTTARSGPTHEQKNRDYKNKYNRSQLKTGIAFPAKPKKIIKDDMIYYLAIINNAKYYNYILTLRQINNKI